MRHDALDSLIMGDFGENRSDLVDENIRPRGIPDDIFVEPGIA